MHNCYGMSQAYRRKGEKGPPAFSTQEEPYKMLIKIWQAATLLNLLFPLLFPFLNWNERFANNNKWVQTPWNFSSQLKPKTLHFHAKISRGNKNTKIPSYIQSHWEKLFLKKLPNKNFQLYWCKNTKSLNSSTFKIYLKLNIDSYTVHSIKMTKLCNKMIKNKKWGKF